ncbi:hypothetical protein FB561_2183 [Kribbella amoyensis]|uniref:Uncharacterized protein n=1 Tax=Kribbella amoyensis TaxID=996641 RepID=A0A561BQB5_9ACTN|nr:hypothetical protein [Kribbella amoyensis]TWD81079.1 hypothetical protein FB561_2183 [Kribbella amoyensis]
MPAQHIGGLPVEELLAAALAAATPLIALLGWEIRDRLRRLRTGINRLRPGSDRSHPDEQVLDTNQ